MDKSTKELLCGWAEKYNDRKYFTEDPIAFPTEFAERFRKGDASLRDVEIAAVFASHLAWGRRAMIVRDCTRLFDQMEWHPEDYVMSGDWRADQTSLHRTIKWSETAAICSRLRDFYKENESLESLTTSEIRTLIFGSRPDPKAPDKKINMMKRWMVRRDGKVDLGLWTESDPKHLIMPLDVHVYTQAAALGLTSRRSKDLKTATEITDAFKEIFPEDPCKGDFALFGYGVTRNEENKQR